MSQKSHGHFAFLRTSVSSEFWQGNNPQTIPFHTFTKRGEMQSLWKVDQLEDRLKRFKSVWSGGTSDEMALRLARYGTENLL